MKQWIVYKDGLMDRPQVWMGTEAEARQWRREGFEVTEFDGMEDE